MKLADARDKAVDLLRNGPGGVDPLDKREADASAAAAEAQRAAIRAITFRTVTERYLKPTKSPGGTPSTGCSGATRSTPTPIPIWRSSGWRSRDRACLAALEPIWRTKPETATRVRGRIESVLDYATSREWRSGENPARWRGHLANLLPARGKFAPVEHHAALPWT